MYSFIHIIARSLAIFGGLLLTLLAILVTLSVIGGWIADIGHWTWLETNAPPVAAMIKATGIRTIVGMYDIIGIGMAFCVFAFLPITQLERGHAVVDVFTNALPRRPNQVLITMWEIVFLIVLILITWRLYFGLERLMKTGMIYQDLQIPQWWGYAAAFVQMILTSLVAAYTTWAQIVKLITGRDILPTSKGAIS